VKIRGQNLLRLFLRFPQRSPILHSFCTTQHEFFVAIDLAFAQSAHSASVSCIEPAGDCGRAGGDRRFSRVNRREGFQNAPWRVQETRALRPPQTVLLKRWTYAASFAVTAGRDSRNKCSRMGRLQRAPETCIPSGTRFRERTPRRLSAASNRRGTHEQCGPGGWPGPHFIFGLHWPRIFADFTD
jgi:hypothetical protein